MADIGIIMLDNDIPRPLGDVGNPDSYDFPVSMATSKGACTAQVLEHSADGLLTAFEDTAIGLQDAGVSAVTTCCGFLAVFQKELAGKLDVPVATSSLLQVALVLQTLGPGRSVCVLTANAATLGETHLAAVGITGDLRSRVHFAGLERTEHFSAVVNGREPELDTLKARSEVVDVARRAVEARPDIGAFVMECTNLPPYTDAVKAATGLPVWDALALINWLHAGASRQRDPGMGTARPTC